MSSSAKLVAFLVLALALAGALALLGGGQDPVTDAVDATGISRDALAPSALGPGTDLEGVAGGATLDGGRSATERAAITGPRLAQRRVDGPEAVEAVTTPYEGRLVDATGAPVRDAAIELRPWSQRDRFQPRFGPFGEKPYPTGESNAKGRFSIPHDERIGKSVAVIAVARGFVDEPLKVVLEDAASTDLGEVRLDDAVIVQGWVRDERGVPVEGARLRHMKDAEDPRSIMMRSFGLGDGDGLGETDRDGRFELAHVRAGELRLVAEHPAHFSGTWEGTTPPAGSILPDLELRLVRGGSISGVVHDFPPGRRGVQVAARLLEAGDDPDAPVEPESGAAQLTRAWMSPAGDESTDVLEDGSFELVGLRRNSRYELRVIERQDFVRTVPLSEPLAVDAGASGVVIDYDAGATVRLRVVDAETKRPIETAELSGNWGERRARIRLAPDAVTRPKRYPDGEMTLHELRPPEDPGQLSLRLSARGFRERRLDPFSVGARDVVDLGDVELEEAPRLRFLVVDIVTGKPISRAQVTLAEPMESDLDARELMMLGVDALGQRAKDRTDRKGRVELDALDVETAELTIRARGYPTYRDPAFNTQDTDDEHRIALRMGGTLEVTVVDPDGQPVERASVRMRRAPAADDDEGERESTNGDGVARWRELEPATYQVRAYRRGAVPPAATREDGTRDDGWLAVRVASGETTPVVLEVPGAGALEGVIYLAGEPLGGASVSLASPSGDPAEQERRRMQRRWQGGGEGDTTAADGRFRIEDINPGAYEVVVSHERLAMDARQPVEVGLGLNEVEVVLVVAAVEGRIVDDAGEPIAGASVTANVASAAAQGDERARTWRRLMSRNEGAAQTDEDGRYRIEGLEPDRELEIRARASGHVSGSTTPMRLAASETRTGIDLQLDRAGAVLVRVLSDPPNPAAALVRARWEGEGTRDEEVEILRGDTLSFDELAPGRWTISLSEFQRGGSQEGASTTVEVAAGETVEAELLRTSQ